MNLRNGIFYITLSLSVGCVRVGPDFSAPHVVSHAYWQNTDDEIMTAQELPQQWWTLFQDDTLVELIEIASSENLSLQKACFQILEAKARLGVTRGEWFPQFQVLEGEVLQQKLSANQANTTSSTQRLYTQLGLGGSVAWELDFWGKFARAIESQEQHLVASFANYDDVMVLLLSQVASTYVEIRAIEQVLHIVKQNIALQQRSLEITQAQFEGGFVSELDVQQATALVEGTKSRIPDLTRQKIQAQNALSVLLGQPPQDLHHLLEPSTGLPQAPQELWVVLPEKLLCRRPDLRMLYALAHAQSARIGVAYADFFPQVSLTGTLGLESNRGANLGGVGSFGFLTKDSLTYGYGANFTLPVLNYGRIKNRVAEEWAKYYQTLVEYEAGVLRAYQEVEDGLSQVLYGQQEVMALQKSVEAAKRATDLANTQYVEGIVDYTRVLTTQQALLEEQERLVLSQSAIILGVIETYKALGGGW